MYDRPAALIVQRFCYSRLDTLVPWLALAVAAVGEKINGPAYNQTLHNTYMNVAAST